MMKPKEKKIVVLVAPSGSGKSTMARVLRQDFPHLHWSVSHTTRPPREGEVHGKDYFFVSEEEFLKLKKEGDFLEWAKVHGNDYGTSKKALQSAMDKGYPLLLDLDIQGADSAKKIFGQDCKVIFLAPPSLAELESRLRKRKANDEKSLQLRLENAQEEIKRKNDFDYLVVNDNFEESYKRVCEIIREILE